MSADLVSSIMTREVVAFHEADAVPDAVRRLVEAGIDGAPVVDADGRPVGMLSASDVIVQNVQIHLPTIVALFGVTVELPGSAARFDHDLTRALASTVGALMHRGAHTISADATVTDAATRLHDEDVSRLPVVDGDGVLVGIVARGDILRYLVGAERPTASSSDVDQVD